MITASRCWLAVGILLGLATWWLASSLENAASLLMVGGLVDDEVVLVLGLASAAVLAGWVVSRCRALAQLLAVVAFALGATVAAVVVLSTNPVHERFTVASSDDEFVLQWDRSDSSSPAELAIFRGGPFVHEPVALELPEPVSDVISRLPRARVVDQSGVPALVYESVDGERRVNLD